MTEVRETAACLEGRIVKALSGFYYVSTPEGIVSCRARGKFRSTGESPLVGDRVTLTVQAGQGTVREILPRRNAFVRPAVANLDAMVILASAAIPVTEPFLIDRMTVIAQRQRVEPILCINKTDLDPADRLRAIYENSGFAVVCTSAETGEGIDRLAELIRGRTVAFTGNSGVGKSALLSRLCPGMEVRTGEVSQKLGRGRHTTRHIELFALGHETFVADTPGFSSFDLDLVDHIPKQELQELFPEFRAYLGGCRFPDCSHRTEPGCAVLSALAAGEIPQSRHRSYTRLYDAAEQVKPWEVR